MTNALRQEAFEIGGKLYTIRVLNVADTRKISAIVNKIVPILTDDDSADLGGLLSAAMSGALTDAEIDKLVSVFAPVTQVDMGDDRVVSLKDALVQDELWSGAIELQYEWLQKCIDLNFEGLLGKSRAAVAKMLAKAREARAAVREAVRSA